jgi:hypothetical protein
MLQETFFSVTDFSMLVTKFSKWLGADGQPFFHAWITGVRQSRLACDHFLNIA